MISGIVNFWGFQKFEFQFLAIKYKQYGHGKFCQIFCAVKDTFDIVAQ